LVACMSSMNLTTPSARLRGNRTIEYWVFLHGQAQAELTQCTVPCPPMVTFPYLHAHGWHGEQVHSSFTDPGNKIGIVIAGNARCTLYFSYIWSCCLAYTASQATPHVQQDAW
jgi:hypothetical protein